MEMLQKIQSEFNRRCGLCAVAGGAVRDTLLKREPKDFDVFIFNDAKDIATTAFDGLEQITVPEWHKSEPFLQATVRFEGKVVQVMSSATKSLDELLDTFDWNVCRFGYVDERVLALTSLSDIGVGKKLRLHRVTYPLSTLRRGFRFSERFHMQFDNAELQSLTSKVSGMLARVPGPVTNK
jgi:tRNA nucleotidyltransferase/poly(A) polymerase